MRLTQRQYDEIELEGAERQLDNLDGYTYACDSDSSYRTALVHQIADLRLRLGLPSGPMHGTAATRSVAKAHEHPGTPGRRDSDVQRIGERSH
jgi:hypothetical protein